MLGSSLRFHVSILIFFLSLPFLRFLVRFVRGRDHHPLPNTHLCGYAGVPFHAQDLFEAAVGEDSEQGLGGETHHVLLFQGHDGVDPDRALLTGIRDPHWPRQEKPGRQQL